MLSFTKKILTSLLCICLIVLSSCKKDHENNFISSSSIEDSASIDLTLRIAVLPMQECDILRYAQTSGLAKTLGLNMELITYNSLMDIDTAILSGSAHVYFEDSLRICRIKDDSIRPKMLLPVPVHFSLIANKDKKISNLKDLRTNMVGLTRWSQPEEWIRSLATESGIEHSDIYHAQINNIELRFNMIHGGLIDAAIIPQPWADSLARLGHIVLKDSILEGMGFYASTSLQMDSVLREQGRLLKEVYLESLKRQQTNM